MNVIESILILSGASLDIFAAMTCQGSLVLKVNKKHLALVCLIVAGLQILAFLPAYALAAHYCSLYPSRGRWQPELFLAILILLALGGHMLFLGIRNKFVEEHLVREFKASVYARIAVGTCLYALLAGLVFGFGQSLLIVLLPELALLSCLAVICGMYTGHHFGFAPKTGAYFAGAILQWIAAARIFLKLWTA